MREAAMPQLALVYCPCPDLDVAKRLGHGLLDAGLAGCINIFPEMLSLYTWKGDREEARETVLIAKTTLGAAGQAREFIEREHPYELPAILVLELRDVNAGYREWLLEGMKAEGKISPQK
jgi:periplasmic divalent cation tolerance protein